MSRPADGLVGEDACSILHIDMDAFYASVELRNRPDLRGRPVIVGGAGSRGVVLSATYEARALGVRSAMPMTRARRLAPAAVVLPPRFSDYAEVSSGVMEILREVTPLVEPLSLDEAFLDITGARRRLGGPVKIGHMLRARVADEQRIPCSVGIAASKFVAKLATTQAKPDGLLMVPPEQVVAFLHPLPVAALWGVGERTEEVLQRLGLRTIGDIAHVPVATLARALGPVAGAHLAALAWGKDERRVVPLEPDKSIGHEETFSRDVDDAEVVHRELLRLAERTAARLRAVGAVSRTISIKVRFADFTTITRSRTLRQPTDVGQQVYATARGLYDTLGLQRARIRLIGVRAENLLPAEKHSDQLILGAPEHGWRDAEAAVDRAIARFGDSAVQPATLVPPVGTTGATPHRLADGRAKGPSDGTSGR